MPKLRAGVSGNERELSSGAGVSCRVSRKERQVGRDEETANL